MRILLVLVISLVLGSCSSQGKESKIEQQKNSSGVTSTVKKGVKPEFNGQYYFVQGEDGPVIVVNKKYPLSADFAPGEDPIAGAAFEDLIKDMESQGFQVSQDYSGYRSYSQQKALYEAYVTRDGQEAADRYSARPGYSEHQIGLTFDLKDVSGQLLEEREANQWLLDHAAEYGFVVRYPKGKEKVTGYMPESWHLRYIGREAQQISSKGLTLEEYYGFEGGDYADERIFEKEK